MTLALKENTRGGIVFYYLRDSTYKLGRIDQRGAGPATFENVVQLGNIRHILQVLEMFIALAMIQFKESELQQAIDDIITSLIEVVLSTGLISLHAHYNDADPNNLLTAQYREALHNVMPAKILKMQGVGIPLGNRPLDASTKPVQLDRKRRIIMPRWMTEALGWRPKDKFYPRLDLQRKTVVLSPVKEESSMVETSKLSFQVIQDFSNRLGELSLCTTEEFRRAIKEDKHLFRLIPENQRSRLSMFFGLFDRLER